MDGNLSISKRQMKSISLGIYKSLGIYLKSLGIFLILRAKNCEKMHEAFPGALFIKMTNWNRGSGISSDSCPVAFHKPAEPVPTIPGTTLVRGIVV